MRSPSDALAAAGWQVGARTRGAGIAYELEVDRGGHRGWATIAPPATSPRPALEAELALEVDGVAPLELVEVEANEWSLIVERVPHGPRASEHEASVTVAVLIGRALARTLSALHARGKLALGVRPERVVVDAGAVVLAPRGEPFVARARAVSIGVPPLYPDSYLALERIHGKPPGPPADVFALAATIFRLATGHHAFEGSGVPQLAAIASGRVVSSGDTFAAAPAFARVLGAALRPDPADRPGLSELAAALDAVAPA